MQNHRDPQFAQNQQTIADKKAFSKNLTLAIARSLTDLIEERRKHAKPNSNLPYFDLKKCDFSIEEYLFRFHDYLRPEQDSYIEPSILIAMLIYLDRFEQASSIQLNSFNIHKLIALAISLAHKFFEDRFYSNKYLANVAGINLQEFNQLEVVMLSQISFGLYISEKFFSVYREQLLGCPHYINACRETSANEQLASNASSSIISSHESVEEVRLKDTVHLKEDTSEQESATTYNNGYESVSDKNQADTSLSSKQSDQPKSLLSKTQETFFSKKPVEEKPATEKTERRKKRKAPPHSFAGM